MVYLSSRDKDRIAAVKESLAAYKAAMTTTEIPDLSLHTQRSQAESLCREVQALRAKLTREAGSLLKRNEYYPDWSIGELLKLEKAFQYNQILQYEDSVQVVDTSSHIITLRSGLEGLNEEHRAAIYHSLYQICELLIHAAKYLRVELPFTIEYNRKNYLLEDHSGLKLAIDFADMLSCEAALLYLFLDLWYLSQLQGVNMATVKGLFDVKALLECPSLGQWKHHVQTFTPNIDLQLSTSVHTEELVVDAGKETSDWLDLESDEET